MNGIFLVETVLQGDSADAVITGVDAEGRRARLELPTAAAASVRPGSALVLQWWTAEVPSMSATLAKAATSELIATSEEHEVSDEGEVGDDERVEREFRALIGLP